MKATTTTPHVVYQHPDGYAFVLHANDYCLTCHLDYVSDPEDYKLDIPIGPDGLIALGLALIEAGHSKNVNAKGGAQ